MQQKSYNRRIVRKGNRYRRRRTKRNLILSFLVIILIVVIGLVFKSCGNGSEETNSGNQEETNSKVDINDTETKQPEVEKKRVVLDAGHGFADGGCTSEYLNGKESEVTLAMVNILKSKLEAAGVEVVLTHNGATFPSANEIKQLANQHGVSYDSGYIINNNIFSANERAVYTSILNKQKTVDLFLSIHINSIAGHPEVSRNEIYYCESNPFATQLQSFCNSLANKLDNEARVTATPYNDSYIVTKYVDCPAVLIESGYATSPDDAAKLNSTTWRDEYCETICKEILSMLNI